MSAIFSCVYLPLVYFFLRNGYSSTLFIFLLNYLFIVESWEFFIYFKYQYKILIRYYRPPWWLRGLRICLQCERPGFDPWVCKIPWRMERQPTPVFWPGEFHGQRSLAGYSAWCRRVGHNWATEHAHNQIHEWKTFFHVIWFVFSFS